MAKRDSNIYGADDNAFAERCSNDALTNTKGKEDVWGNTLDQAARAKGNVPEAEDEKATARSKDGKQGDKRADSKGD